MIIKLMIVLFALMLVVGGNRGLDSFFALIRTMLAFLANIYLISWGTPPILTTALVSIFVVVTVIYFQNGFNGKMHAATFSVVVVLGMIMVSAGPLLWSAGISGYDEIEQYEEISMYLSADLQVSMSAVMLSAVMLGLLGAVIDTAVAITTAMNEVYVNRKGLSPAQLFRSGMTIGKDILGTTMNTLFFAGIGEGIMLAVLFMRNGDTFSEIINSKALFREVSGMVMGAAGCLLIIPVSSIICASCQTLSQDKEVCNKNMLRKCYIYCKKVLKNVKNVLK